MKKRIVVFGIVFLCTLCILHGKENSIEEKITALLKTNTVEITDNELNSFYGDAIKKHVIKKLHEVYRNDETVDALTDYITVDNYEIINVIKLKNGNLFLNYWVRSDGGKRPQKEQSEKTLGRLRDNYHVFFIYNPEKKQITYIKYTYSAYSLLPFHKYVYAGNLILYGIGNNSSFGMAKTDMYFLAFSADNLELLFSERIDFSQRFYSREVDDIAFQKDFIFDKNTIRFLGKNFDFDSGRYKDYDKSYTLP